MSSITDKAEVSIDFPEKAYMGSFGRGSSFEARADAEGVLLRLERAGDERRVVDVHLHYYLFADILRDIADSLAARPPLDEAHRLSLVEAAEALARAARRR